MTVHESGDQCSCPAVDDSNGGSVSLPLVRRPDPMDAPVANLYGHFRLRGRVGPIPKLNVVNQELQFSRRSPSSSSQSLIISMSQPVENAGQYKSNCSTIGNHRRRS